MCDPDRVIKRADRFLEMSGTILTGDRRMSAGHLLDIVMARILSVNSDTNIIRIKNLSDGCPDRVRREMSDEKENCIFIYCEVGDTVLKRIIETFPDAYVYRAQELCHQLPACIRES